MLNIAEQMMDAGKDAEMKMPIPTFESLVAIGALKVQTKQVFEARIVELQPAIER